MELALREYVSSGLPQKIWTGTKHFGTYKMDKALIILLNLRSFTTGKNVVVVGSGVDVVAGV